MPLTEPDSSSGDRLHKTCASVQIKHVLSQFRPLVTTRSVPHTHVRKHLPRMISFTERHFFLLGEAKPSESSYPFFFCLCVTACCLLTIWQILIIIFFNLLAIFQTSWTASQFWNSYCITLSVFSPRVCGKAWKVFQGRERGGTSQGYHSLVPQKAWVVKRTFRVTVLNWHTKHIHRKSEFMSSNVHV